MKPNEITINTYIAIDGQLWPIQIKAEVEAEDYKVLLKHTVDMISKLKSAGFKLFATSEIPASVGSTVRVPHQRSSPAFTWPAPMCPDCKKEMRVSKFQTDETKFYYHCTVKLPTGAYCKQCAATDNRTGETKYWEADK